MAQFGEDDRDPDHNHLIDYGDDHNLLEIKTTGSGPGYIHEVPEFLMVSGFMSTRRLRTFWKRSRIPGTPGAYQRFRKSAAEVRRAVNEILWVEMRNGMEPGKATAKLCPSTPFKFSTCCASPDWCRHRGHGAWSAI